MKRIIWLLLCLIMIIPAAVSTAAANPGISSVSVSFTPPKAGTRASVRPSAQTPSGLNYTYNAGSSYWFDANTLQQLPSSAVLQAGKKYFARLCIEPKDSGDCFDDDVQVICTGSGITKVTVQRGRAQLFVHAYFTPQPVEKVALKKIQNVRLKSPKKGRIDVSWKQLTAKQRKKTSKIQIQYSQIKTFTKNVKTPGCIP